MSNEFDYLSHDEDGDEEEIDLMEDTSDGEAMSDEEEIGNGKVADTEDEEEDEKADEKIDITPEKPKITPKVKAKAKSKSKKVRPTVDSPPKSVKKKPESDIVDVSQYTRARFHKSPSTLAYVLPQPNTTEDRIDCCKRGKALPVTQQIQHMITKGTMTRDNCVKVVTFTNNGDPTGFRSTFEYHFGVWTRNGEFQPLNVAQEKLLISADFKSKSLKGPHQTPVKWIRDKKNMADPESYHVVNHEGKAHNVPMPVSCAPIVAYA